MPCISTKIEDCGHFIPFNQIICRSKQDICKNGKRIFYIVLKVLSNEKIKNILCDIKFSYDMQDLFARRMVNFAKLFYDKCTCSKASMFCKDNCFPVCIWATKI